MGILDTLLKPRLVGLDIGVSGIKAVELQGTTRPRLMAYNRVPLPIDTISPDGEIRDRPTVVEALKRLFGASHFSTKKVAVGASGNGIMTKKIVLNRMDEEEVRHQLYFEAEQYIPFNPEEVNLDFAIIGDAAESEGTPMMNVLLVAAKKEFVNSLSSIVQEAGLSPEIIDLQAFALGNVFEFNYGHLARANTAELNVIIDFGAGSTKVSVVEGDKTTFTRELRQCGTSCTVMLAEQLNVPLDQAETIKIQGNSPRVSEVTAAFVALLVDEISRTLDFCLSQVGDKTVRGIYVCGGASRTEGLLNALAQKLPGQVQPLNPIQSIAGSGKKMNANAVKELTYLGAVAIGLALRTVGDSK